MRSPQSEPSKERLGLIRLKSKFAFSALLTFIFGLVFAGAAQAQVVAFGASNVSGYGVAEREAFPAQLQALLRARGLDIVVLNAGVFGNTTADLRNRVSSDIPQGTKVVILDVSGPYFNNSSKGVSEAQGHADIAAIEADLSARGIKVVEESARAIARQHHQDDGIHLTAEGHRLLAASLLPQVMRALGRRS